MTRDKKPRAEPPDEGEREAIAGAMIAYPVWLVSKRYILLARLNNRVWLGTHWVEHSRERECIT